MVKKKPGPQAVVSGNGAVGKMAYIVGEKPLLLCGNSAPPGGEELGVLRNRPGRPLQRDHLGGNDKQLRFFLGCHLVGGASYVVI